MAWVALESSWLSEFGEYPHPEALAWTGHRLPIVPIVLQSAPIMSAINIKN